MEWEERPLGEPQAQSMTHSESLGRWGCGSSQAPALGSSQCLDHIFCQTFLQHPSPSQVSEVEYLGTQYILWEPHH